MNESTNLTISQAAEILQVHPNTLRNWEKDHKLNPYRDPATGYRYYSPIQIRDFLIRDSQPKVQLYWGYKEAEELRRQELTEVKKSLDVIVSSDASTNMESQIDQELLSLQRELQDKGVRVRFIRNLEDALMKKRAVTMKDMGIETRHMKVSGVTISTRDEKVVRIETPNEQPDHRLNLIIHDVGVAKSFSIMFGNIWERTERREVE